MHPLRSHLPGNGHQRNPVSIRVGNTGHQVGSTRPQGGKAYPGFSRKPPVDIRHKSRPLLMPGEDEFYCGTAQGIHHRKIFFSGDAEYIFYSLVFKTFNH